MWPWVALSRFLSALRCWLALCGGVSALGHSKVASWQDVFHKAWSFLIPGLVSPYIVENWRPALHNFRNSVLIFIKVCPLLCVEHFQPTRPVLSGFGAASVKALLWVGKDTGKSRVLWDAFWLELSKVRVLHVCLLFPTLGHGLVYLESRWNFACFFAEASNFWCQALSSLWILLRNQRAWACLPLFLFISPARLLCSFQSVVCVVERH